MSDSYLELSKGARTELKAKGSRFIAEAIPVSSVEEAEEEVGRIRKRDYNASHHCIAYRLGPDGSVFRSSDDGEPSGSAGRPILRQIEGRGLTNTLVVVTRYFGGTKLGTGGLVRAYGDAAAAALDAASFSTVILRSSIRVTFAYADTSPAMHTIQRFDTVIEETDYGDETSLRVAVRMSQADAFVAAFLEALSGRCTIKTEDG